MEQTSNYQLNQWAESDRILRTDFNSDNAKIEAALAEHSQKLDWQGNIRIETGTYVGTGNYGEDHPCTLHFSGKPLAILVGGWENTLIAVRSAADYIYSMGISTNNLVFTTWGDTSISWYAGAAPDQCNMSDKTYTYLVFLAED